MWLLPEGSSPKINRKCLMECHPYTEIFSKRRKIYSVCVEGWEDESDKTSVTLGQLFQFPVEILSLYKRWFVQSFQYVCKAKKTLAIDHTEKNIFRQNIFCFLWQRTCPKNVDFSLNPQRCQNWYFAHWQGDVGQAVSQYRFSAFWLRSKCSICSYQLNIW